MDMKVFTSCIQGSTSSSIQWDESPSSNVWPSCETLSVAHLRACDPAESKIPAER